MCLVQADNDYEEYNMHEKYNHWSWVETNRDIVPSSRQENKQGQQDSNNPNKALTNEIPLLTSQLETSWSKAVAKPNIEFCEGRMC